GGGIYSFTTAEGAPNNLTVLHSTLTGNIGGIDGGAIRKERGTLYVDDCTISNNTTQHTGGAISTEFGVKVTIIGTTIAGNRATGATWWGGGIYAGDYASSSAPGYLIVASSVISGNSADQGGGIWTACPTTVTDSVISDNSAVMWGGGISGGVPLVI